MQKIFLLFHLIVMVAVGGCSSDSSEKSLKEIFYILSDSSLNACCPYLTVNAFGEQVLVFTAENIDNESFVYFAAWDQEKGIFKNPRQISETKGAAMSEESMSKVAFKKNGEVIVAFSIKKPTESNPYGGEISYVTSKDDGNSWSASALLHEDTASGNGRSYFDLASLADGEVGACWLDASYPDGGRPVKFSKTFHGKGFINETLVDSLACECCRTKIIQDHKGDIHIAFRDVNVIKEDLHIRDMMVSTSKNGGISFTSATPLSNDKWQLIGCPHSGPGLSMSQNKMHAAWFTAGGKTGIYYTSTKNVDKGFNSREFISKEGKNPQILAIGDDLVAITWSEFSSSEEPNLLVGDHNNNLGHHKKIPSTGYSRIMLMLKSDKGSTIVQVSEDGHNAGYPVLQGNGTELIVAWTEGNGGQQSVVYKRISAALQ